MSTVEDTMSTPGGVQYTGAYHDECGGYHEYIGGVQYTGDIMSTLGCSVHQEIIMSTLGDIKIHVGGYHEYTGGVQYTGWTP